ncbi:transposon Tf2-9 polyprotein [Trichonephila clavipes]|nr:transposon Tf2-9 polyprotein [Trichonephila clavipes]
MFDYEVKYLKGTNNVEADMLSRHPIAQYIQHSVHLLELSEIKTHQNLDNVNDPKYRKVDDVFVLKKKNLFEIVVPFSLRRKILQNAHEHFGHPGTQKMINLITPQYYWPHINLDISKFVKHCNVCQLNKRKRQKRFGLLQTVPPTDQPFEYISVDTLSLSVGGFNYYNSTKKCLHLIIDHATRYVWAFASKSETTETYANCLKQLFQIQIPNKLLTDRNGAFTSSRFKRFLRNYNVKQLLTTSHHPQTNVTKFPPAYLLFGTLPYTPPLAQNQVYPPVEEARKLAKENTIKYHEKNKIKYDARFIDSPFEPGDLVIYEEFNYPNRRKLSPIFSGPYEIVQKLPDVNYEITKPNALTKKPTEIVHVSKLRTYYPPEELKLSHE